jgi:hypothetical protein
MYLAVLRIGIRKTAGVNMKNMAMAMGYGPIGFFLENRE